MRSRVILAAILAALLQTGVIAGILVNRALHIAHGREIVLDVIPVDPRDLLRGDYVRLGYPIARLAGAMMEIPEHPYKGMPIFVTLEHQGKAGEEKWVAVAASAVRPAVPESDSKIVLQGNLQWWYPHRDPRTNESHPEMNLRYGIETGLFARRSDPRRARSGETDPPSGRKNCRGRGPERKGRDQRDHRRGRPARRVAALSRAPAYRL